MDSLVWFVGFMFVSNCKTCSPLLKGVALQLVIYKIVVYLGPILLFISIFFFFGSFLFLFSRFKKWQTRNRFNRNIGKIPVYKFAAGQAAYGDTAIPAGNADCAICLVAYEEGIEIRILKCKHHYHSECIDQWICLTPTCPLCKRDVFPEDLVHPPEQAEENV